MEKLIRIVSYLFLVTIPFGYRTAIYQFTPGWHEYEIAWLYVTDIALLAFLGVGLFYIYRKRLWQFNKSDKILAVWLGLGLISIVGSQLPLLALYALIRLLGYVLMVMVLSRLIKERVVKIEVILKILISLTLIEALIAIEQFRGQSSLGWWWLGEPTLSPFINGVGKIIISGGQVLRAHGTFLHPNILGSWLMLGWIATLSWLVSESGVKKYLALINTYIVALAMALTFSRSGWISLIVVTGLFLCLTNFKNTPPTKVGPHPNGTRQAGQGRKELFKWLLVILFIGITAVWPVKDFVWPRTQIKVEEVAVTERVSYLNLGREIIKENLTGVGIGNQVYYSYQSGLYKQFNLKNLWQWQPIHNFYVLMASEIGVLGLLVWLWLINNLVSKSYKSKKKLVSVVMMVGLLTLGLFDHYLWTIAGGQIMLWLIIGLLL